MPSRLTVVLVSLLFATPVVVFWLWLVIVRARVTLLCPVECRHDPVLYHVSCSISSLNSIPSVLPTNVRKLLLESNSITSLEDRFISSRLTELQEISVIVFERETVKLSALSELRKLALLSVCGNTLCEITQRTFEMLNCHAYLILVDNIFELCKSIYYIG